MTRWNCVLELDSGREVTGGSPEALCAAIRRGADLRIYTEFIHNQHIDPASASDELIREVSEFRATYLVDAAVAWCAGIMTLRQPIALPDGFGPRASMSFFMYNQDGQQAIARPYLDGGPAAKNTGLRSDGMMGPAALPPHLPAATKRASGGRPAEAAAECENQPAGPDDWSAYPKYHQQDGWDAGTNAPSSNFIYDFEVFRYHVCDDWQEVLAHDSEGRVQAGSIDLLAGAFEAGAEIKVAICNLCADLAAEPAHSIEHQVFIQVGPGYYYSGQKLFIAGTHPLVRVRPGVPMRYVSRGWDFGWLMPRTDGRTAMLLYDPYTLQVRRETRHFAMRWFTR